MSFNKFPDVDTPEPDEKSVITYVSQLYDVFPEPPPGILILWNIIIIAFDFLKRVEVFFCFVWN